MCLGVGAFWAFLEGEGEGKQIVLWQIRRTNYRCVFRYTPGLAYS